MNIPDFIEKWNAKLDFYTQKDGNVSIPKTQVMSLRIDIYGLRKYDPHIGNNTKYVSVFEAGKEWWNARGIYSIESIAARYGLRFEVLNEYITAYLNVKDWIEPFSHEYTIWDLYYFGGKGKPKDVYFISAPNETV